MIPPVLEATNIHHAFAGLQVLRGVDLLVPTGCILGLVGTNGAGKSTLLNVLGGYVTSQDGSIKVGGIDVTGLPVHKRAELGVGRVFQDSLVWSSLSVSQHYSVVSKREELRVAAVRKIADACKRPIASMTLFQRRMLELSLAGVVGKELLLIDEIGAGLSMDECGKIYRKIVLLVQQKCCRAAIVIEHKTKVLLTYATEICLLEDGKISDRFNVSDNEKIASLQSKLWGKVIEGR